MKRIMLICGSGASSGFMAASMRKAAKSMGEEVEIFARSETELGEHIQQLDIVLLGAHLKYRLEELRNKYSSYPVMIDVIDVIDYGTLNGKATLEKALMKLNTKEENA